MSIGPAGRLRNDRGGTLVLVAVMILALTSMAALAIDLSMLFDSRAQAQRAADAAALAGASAFRDLSNSTAPVPAHDRAMLYASQNRIRGTLVDTTREVAVTILQPQYRVRVTVTRANINTWFARLLGRNLIQVQATATAEAAQSGRSNCVKSFAIPDLWHETNTSSGRTGQDQNANKLWDPTEGWQYEPASGDTYAPYDPTSPSSSQTGYGSGYRNGVDAAINDFGRTITLKAQQPSTSITSSFFYPWRVPLAAGGTSAGASDYRNVLEDTTCTVVGPVDVNVSYSIENGNMVGPTRSAINTLISDDPSAVWNPTAGPDGKGQVVTPKYSDWRSSPRVVTLGLFDPSQIAGVQGGGGLNIKFNNFALFFIEGFLGSGAQAPVLGRFLYSANGSGSGPTVGSLVRTLRLVQ